MKPFDAKTPTVPLGASEQEVRARLDAGEPVVFPEGDPGQRVIEAAWITKFDVPIRIANAVIRGDWNEPYAEFKSVVSMVKCEFEGQVNLRGAKFGKVLQLSGSRFRQQVALTSVDVADDLQLTDAVFKGKVVVRDAHIGKVLIARGTKFLDSLWCTRLKVDKAAFFTPHKTDGKIVIAEFHGYTSFIDAEFSVTAEFDGALFSGTVEFTRAKVGAEAFFRRAVTVYHATADTLVPVEAAQQPAVVFQSRALFRHADFKGLAVFTDATFESRADFTRLRVGSDALFGGVHFQKQAEFTAANVAGALTLTRAVAENIDLRRASTGVLTFSEDDAGKNALQAKAIDGNGLSFDRFEGDWRRFLRLIQPFSRDPYDSLERHLRAAGDESHARDVYFERRKRQGQELRRRATLRDFPRAFLLDPFERYISRYGVRSFGLFFATFLLVALGMLVFTRFGALEPKPPNVKTAPSCEEAVVYSVALVIPLVQLPPIERWRPSANPIPLPGPYTTITFETFSAIYRLAGFLFVPLAVAVVTGLLYRRDRT